MIKRFKIPLSGGGGTKNVALNRFAAAFNLPEVVITLLIIAVLSAILFPVLNKARPDENEALHKKATFIVERVVNELITDNFLYPDQSEFTGFKNTSSVIINGTEHTGDTKFCSLFASRINLAAGSSINCQKNAKSFTSVEGIDWYLPISNFKDKEFEIIKVDVNGSKGPNCVYNQNSCKRPDQFIYQIRGGTKVPSKVVQNFDKTPPPPGRGERPGEPDVASVPKNGLKWWSIICKVTGSGTVYGMGEHKVNGHYQLVAVPSPGYVGSWFTKNVTVKDADFTDCDVSFTKIDRCLIPGVCDNNPDTPPPPPPPPPVNPDEAGAKTYCINKVVTGETDGCKISGTNPKECGLEPGVHNLTATANDGYETNWADNKKDVTIIDKDVTATLECIKKEEEKCYNITANITGMCAVSGTGCKAPGTYTINITPADGWTTASTSKQVILGESDVSVDVTCTETSPPPEKDPDACCETKYGAGAKFIKSQNKCVLDKGLITQSWDCKNRPEYCIGPLKGFQFATSVWPTAYKTCLDSSMHLPSISEIETLYYARSSVFAYSSDSPNIYGYWTTTPNGSPYGCETFRYLHVPTTGQVHSACHTHPHVKAMCVGDAPAICATEQGPDPGHDNGQISIKLTTTPQAGVHFNSANYTVSWTNVVDAPGSLTSAKRKYVVKASSVYYYHRYYYTYYGVTSGVNGSYSGTITNIPDIVTSDKIYLSVSFE